LKALFNRLMYSVLLTLAKGNNRQIRLGVEHEELAKIKIGNPVTISSINNNPEKYDSTISHITNQIDPITGLIDVIVTLNNAPHLIPGTMVKGQISIQPETKVIAVPLSALLYEKNKPYLFVIKEKHAVIRWVKIGKENATMVAINQGVNIGDSIVTIGNYELTNGMEVLEQKQ
jgi:RND family efflux transporter MFP subunit